MAEAIELEILDPPYAGDCVPSSVEVIEFSDSAFADLLDPKFFVDLTAEDVIFEEIEPIGTGGGGGGGGTIPATNNLLKGDNTGNAADSKIKSSEAVAAENLSAFDIVTVDGFKANSGTPAHLGKVIGITRSAVLTGFVADVIYYGEIVNGSWSWTAGQKLFLNGTSLSTTPPASGFVQMIAVAKNATTITMRVEIPVLL